MAGALVLDDPRRFAGAVLLSGALAFDAGIPIGPGRLAGVPIFYAHGTQDEMIPPDLAARTARYLETQSGATLVSRRYPIAHGISKSEITDIAQWLLER